VWVIQTISVLPCPITIFSQKTLSILNFWNELLAFTVLHLFTFPLVKLLIELFFFLFIFAGGSAMCHNYNTRTSEKKNKVTGTSNITDDDRSVRGRSKARQSGR
jgi:hypothetical protein